MKTYEKLLLRRVFAKLSVESELRLDTSRLPMESSLMTFWCIIPPSLTVPQSILTIFLRSIRFPLWSRTEPVSLSLLSSVGFFHSIFVRDSYNCENCKIRLVNHKRILLNLPPTDKERCASACAHSWPMTDARPIQAVKSGEWTKKLLSFVLYFHEISWKDFVRN